ncbi:hypothetical protein WJX84_012076 [Apatococcus fuscideae]|uniref:mannan endo-1,4-beta-mannosidase n=1 Tax=Apatococcus fuscideae TaxID=2026836 RepID=A0AAW1SZ30_9CHLO
MGRRAPQLCLLSAFVALALPQGLQASAGFIRAYGGKFVDEECKPFLASGVNTWELMEVASGAVESKKVQLSNGQETDVVQWTLATAAANSLTVMRMFAHGVHPDFPLQIAPGEYNEKAFKALDYILDEASKLGIRVIMTLGDNWVGADSKPIYSSWSISAEESEDPDAFFSDPKCRQDYKNHIKKMVNRKNTRNKRLYKDDPTIFAWDLMNEPRCDCFPEEFPPPVSMTSCRPECAHKLQAWIVEMSTYLKEQDPKHMVTVGEEGFWGPGAKRESANPGNGWASLTGQNFTANMNLPTIDFAAVHLWPDNWEHWDLAFLDTWILEHAADARAMGKPFMIEEFGKQVHMETPVAQANITSVRTPFYRKVYKAYLDSIAAGDDLVSGLVFWQWGYTPYVDRSHFEGCLHCFAIQVTPSDAIFTNIIHPSAEKALKTMRSAPAAPGCTPVPEKQRTRLSLASADLGSSGGLSSMVDALRPKASGQSASLPADAKLSESSAKPGKIIPAVAGDKGPLGMVQDPVTDLDNADLPADALRSMSTSKGPKRTRLMDHSHQRPVHSLKAQPASAVKIAGAAAATANTAGIRRQARRFVA